MKALFKKIKRCNNSYLKNQVCALFYLFCFYFLFLDEEITSQMLDQSIWDEDGKKKKKKNTSLQSAGTNTRPIPPAVILTGSLLHQSETAISRAWTNHMPRQLSWAGT